MPRVSSRQRMVQTTMQLVRRQGYNGTGLNQIIEESKAPKGSLYHFFKSKDDLVAEAVREGAAEVMRQMREAMQQAADLKAALTLIVKGIIDELRASNFEAGCPISTVAGETTCTSGPLQKACSAAFRAIQGVIEQALLAEGRPPAAAASLSNLVLCAYEGALLLSRTHHDTRPLEEMVESLTVLIPPPPAQA